MATIKDIAQLVSVSQLFPGGPKGDKSLAVSPETRQAIFEAAQELDYTKHLKKIQSTDSH